MLVGSLPRSGGRGPAGPVARLPPLSMAAHPALGFLGLPLGAGRQLVAIPRRGLTWADCLFIIFPFHVRPVSFVLNPPRAGCGGACCTFALIAQV